MSKKRKARFKEPSTWAGIGVLLAAIAPVAGPAAPILAALSGAAGGVAMILREGEAEAQKGPAP